ncbi:MAG: hypothetical protein PHG40_03275, partial [Candidatus Omnitrophica bacterium]|nr:hypothetical protein [Candidatus Omnitrophota bacterium]
MKKPRILFKVISFLLCFSLIFQQSGFAQIAGQLDISGYIAQLRQSLATDTFRPLHLRYLSYDNLNNNFKLLLDKGDQLKRAVPKIELENTSKILLNYFFIGVSLPNDTFWVNLRPDSPEQIIDNSLAQTDVGKILLEADLQLKKDTAKFTSPETPEGREYWNKLYQKAGEIFGYDNVTIPTLTRPWIVPDEIIIRESDTNAYIYKATLKVMLEQDYLKNSASYSFKDERLKQLNEYSSQLIRELIIPKITKEINIAKRYAPLRQVYYSLIMAQWFKQKFYGKGGLYSWLIDRKSLAGLTSAEQWSKDTYFKAYQKSFKEGEYNFKEPVQTPFGQSIRSYFSGGVAIIGATVAGAKSEIDVGAARSLSDELSARSPALAVDGGTPKMLGARKAALERMPQTPVAPFGEALVAGERRYGAEELKRELQGVLGVTEEKWEEESDGTKVRDTQEAIDLAKAERAVSVDGMLTTSRFVDYDLACREKRQTEIDLYGKIFVLENAPATADLEKMGNLYYEIALFRLNDGRWIMGIGNDRSPPVMMYKDPKIIAMAEVVIHNHPGGVLAPSHQDMDVAARMRQAKQIIIAGQSALIYSALSSETQHKLEVAFAARMGIPEAVAAPMPNAAMTELGFQIEIANREMLAEMQNTGRQISVDEQSKRILQLYRDIGMNYPVLSLAELIQHLSAGGPGVQSAAGKAGQDVAPALWSRAGDLPEPLLGATAGAYFGEEQSSQFNLSRDQINTVRDSLAAQIAQGNAVATTRDINGTEMSFTQLQAGGVNFLVEQSILSQGTLGALLNEALDGLPSGYQGKPLLILPVAHIKGEDNQDHLAGDCIQNGMIFLHNNLDSRLQALNATNPRFATALLRVLFAHELRHEATGEHGPEAEKAFQAKDIQLAREFLYDPALFGAFSQALVKAGIIENDGEAAKGLTASLAREEAVKIFYYAPEISAQPIKFTKTTNNYSADPVFRATFEYLEAAYKIGFEGSTEVNNLERMDFKVDAYPDNPSNKLEPDELKIIQQIRTKQLELWEKLKNLPVNIRREIFGRNDPSAFDQQTFERILAFSLPVYFSGLGIFTTVAHMPFMDKEGIYIHLYQLEMYEIKSVGSSSKYPKNGEPIGRVVLGDRVQYEARQLPSASKSDPALAAYGNIIIVSTNDALVDVIMGNISDEGIQQFIGVPDDQVLEHLLQTEINPSKINYIMVHVKLASERRTRESLITMRRELREAHEARHVVEARQGLWKSFKPPEKATSAKEFIEKISFHSRYSETKAILSEIANGSVIVGFLSLAGVMVGPQRPNDFHDAARIDINNKLVGIISAKPAEYGFKIQPGNNIRFQVQAQLFRLLNNKAMLLRLLRKVEQLTDEEFAAKNSSNEGELPNANERLDGPVDEGITDADTQAEELSRSPVEAAPLVKEARTLSSDIQSFYDRRDSINLLFIARNDELARAEEAVWALGDIALGQKPTEASLTMKTIEHIAGSREELLPACLDVCERVLNNDRSPTSLYTIAIRIIEKAASRNPRAIKALEIHALQHLFERNILREKVLSVVSAIVHWGVQELSLACLDLLEGILERQGQENYYERAIKPIETIIETDPRFIRASTVKALGGIFLREGLSGGIYEEAGKALKQIKENIPSLLKGDPLCDLITRFTGHTLVHYNVLLSPYFAQRTQGMHEVEVYSVGLAAYRLLSRIKREVNEDNIGKAVELVLEGRRTNASQIVFNEVTDIINIAHSESRFRLEDMKKLEMAAGAKNIRPGLKGMSKKYQALDAIAGSDVNRPLTIFFNGHGGSEHIWLEKGHITEQESADLSNPLAISYVELGNNLLKRGKDLSNVVILLNSCYSYNFSANLLHYLNKNGATTMPYITSASNYDRFAYGENLIHTLSDIIDKKPGNPLVLADIFEAEKNIFEQQDLAVFTPEQSLIEKYFGKIDLGESLPENPPLATKSAVPFSSLELGDPNPRRSIIRPVPLSSLEVSATWSRAGDLPAPLQGAPAAAYFSDDMNSQFNLSRDQINTVRDSLVAQIAKGQVVATTSQINGREMSFTRVQAGGVNFLVEQSILSQGTLGSLLRQALDGLPQGLDTTRPY